MTLGPERGARHGDHSDAIEQELCQRHRTVDAADVEQLGDVGQGVERAVGRSAAHAGHRLQRRHQQVAVAAAAGHLLGGAGAAALERRSRPDHREAGRMRRGVALHASQAGDHVARAERVADPPAGHRERLGEGGDPHDVIGELRRHPDSAERRLARRHVAVVESLVGGVDQQHDVAPRGDLGEPPQRVVPDHRAGGIAGAVDQHHPGTVADRRDEGVGIEGEAALRRAFDRDRPPADQGDLRRQAAPARGRQHHLVAGIEQRHHRAEQGGLRSHGDQDVAVAGPRRTVPAVVADQGSAQIRCAVDRRIARETGGEGLSRRLDGADRRREARLAGAQVDQIAALTGQLGGAARHSDGRRFGGRNDPGGELDHGRDGTIRRRREARSRSPRDGLGRCPEAARPGRDNPPPAQCRPALRRCYTKPASAPSPLTRQLDGDGPDHHRCRSRAAARRRRRRLRHGKRTMSHACTPPTLDRRRSCIVAALLAALLPWLGGAPQATAQRPGEPAKVIVEAVADRTSYLPGEVARLALRAVVEDGWHIQSNTPSFEYLIPTEAVFTVGGGLSPGEVLYPPHEMWQSSFEAEPLAVYDGEVVFLTTVAIPTTHPAGDVTVSSTLFYQACDERICLRPTEATYEMAISVGAAGEEQLPELFAAAQAALDGAVAPPSGGSPGAGAGWTMPARAPGLAWMLVLGVLGGLILNLMPCVLPVLSLKVFGLVGSAGKGDLYVRTGALATTAGILFSFWILAVGVIALRGAGQAVGWGIQFQNPVFVALLAVIVVLFSLNLWGLFEIPMPGVLRGVGPGSGLAGHFASGLFATLMATPCSAPFLGTAVGFGLSQPAWTTLAIFTAVGVGMSLPYLVLALRPGAVRLLPRPGAWMETLRGVLGFLLAGAAIWLLFVLAAQLAPVTLALVQAGLLTIGLFAWLMHRSRSEQPRRAWLPRVAALGMVLASVAVLLIASRADGNAEREAGGGRLAWTPFDRAAAEARAAGGELVFVDVTADWCATCKVNERVVLESAPVVEAFERLGVVPMKADWTNRDDAIAAYLADFGRYAIPFYVLYRPGREPHVFGELLTRGSVLEVLEESALPASSVAQELGPAP
ncbi:MAG: hypothetical protein DWQ30_13895 [Acidobacteria bacterium]|nr:MAG: hypothetical protein DWQ30_13895 [Acidobacteriota bacterium]